MRVLYHCLKGTPHRWPDLAAFCQASFRPPWNQINRIRYFTAHVNARPNNPEQRVRQQTYRRALRTIPHLTIHLGSYLEKPTRMPLHPPPATGPKTVQVTKSEEKGSDVNVASYLLVDAFDDNYETAVVVSNDSDLAEPMRLVRQKLRSHDPAVFHLDDSVGHVRDPRIVRHHEDRAALLAGQPHEQVNDLAAGLTVQG